jgi:threonyl-tRNA synthetase
MQLKITLKDGSIKTYPKGITGLEIAQSISPSLAKRVVAVKVDDREIDSYIPIQEDAKLELITADTKEGLEVLRHDMAHILADAVKELYPETQVTIGPNIEDGFYYDFYREQSFTPDD